MAGKIGCIRTLLRLCPCRLTIDDTADCQSALRSYQFQSHASAFPVLDLVVIFVSGNLGDGAGELHRAGGLLDLAAQAARHGIEVRGGEVGNIAGGNFRFDFSELRAERADPVGHGGEPLVGQSFQLDGPEVLDLELMFAAPRDEGGLGDIQLGHEAGEGPSLGAEFDESLNGILIFHSGMNLDHGVILVVVAMAGGFSEKPWFNGKIGLNPWGGG